MMVPLTDLPIRNVTQMPRVAIVGGGLAGLAAAVGLAGRGLRVQLFEARRRLGGRAASFTDAATGEAVDYCQHVSMGCCTNLADFCRRTDTADLFRRDRVLHLFTRDGRSSRLSGSRLLPAPFHLAPALLRLHYLSWRERLAIGSAMMRLARARPEELSQRTVAEWLTSNGQSPRAIEQFWGAVLVSALGESVERSSMLHAQKVFVDAYLAAPTGYELYVPRVSLGELYGARLTDWLTGHGVELLIGANVEQIDAQADRLMLTAGNSMHECDAVVLAVPWQRVKATLAPAVAAALPELSGLEQIDAAPITGVHLWFDRQITELEHAAMVDMLSQWVFRRTDPGTVPIVSERSAETMGLSPSHPTAGTADEYYYQVVISASRHIAGRDREEVVAEIFDELRDVFPAARQAKLLRWKMVSDPTAVFSVRPGIEALRPPQTTSVARLFLAGDWTLTGWPSTMEGAVRSGYLAAEAVLKQTGRTARLLAPDLPRGWLARRIVGPIAQR